MKTIDEDERFLELDTASRIEEAQRRYFKSPKGRASQKRYMQSDLGKKTLSRVQRAYYQRKKEKERLAKAYLQYLQENPNGTVDDFLKAYEKQKEGEA